VVIYCQVFNLVSLLLTCVLPIGLWSQTGSAFRSNVELVAIPCTAVDANGVAVSDLRREEFQVYDNGVRRIVDRLWVDANEPVTIGIIIDASESQRDLIAGHYETAANILERILRPHDRAFVLSVDEEVRLRVDITAPDSELRKRIAGYGGDPFGEPCPRSVPRAPGLKPGSVCGSTPLWNAVHDAARLKLRARTGIKVLLVLSDGFDSGSTRTMPEAADEVNKAGASLYAVQYPSGFGRILASDLYRLAIDTGGAWFRASNREDDQIVSRIENDLRRRYVLGFRPEKITGKLRHEVQIEVTRPSVSVRARKTYFDRP
jgi:VWFA-related protein